MRGFKDRQRAVKILIDRYSLYILPRRDSFIPYIIHVRKCRRRCVHPSSLSLSSRGFRDVLYSAVAVRHSSFANSRGEIAQLFILSLHYHSTNLLLARSRSLQDLHRAYKSPVSHLHPHPSPHAPDQLTMHNIQRPPLLALSISILIHLRISLHINQRPLIQRKQEIPPRARLNEGSHAPPARLPVIPRPAARREAVLDDLAAGRGGCQLRRASQVADELELGEGARGGGAEGAEWRGRKGARGAEHGTGEHVCGFCGGGGGGGMI